MRVLVVVAMLMTSDAISQQVSWVRDLPWPAIGLVQLQDGNVVCGDGSLGLSTNWQGEETAGLSLPHVWKMRQSPDGGFVVAGGFINSMTFDDTLLQGGLYNIFLAKFNCWGTREWIRVGIELDSYGLGPVDLTVGSDGTIGMLVQSGPTLSYEGEVYTLPFHRDYHLMKFDPTGHVLWEVPISSHSIHSGLDGSVTHIAIDGTSHVWVAGNQLLELFVGTDTIHAGTDDLYDQFIMRFDSAGALAAHKEYLSADGLHTIWCGGLLPMGSHNMTWFGAAGDGVVLSEDTLLSNGASDALITLLTPELEPSWITQISSAGSDVINAAALDPVDGSIVIAGVNGPDLIVGGDTIHQTDQHGCFLISLSVNGTPISGQVFAVDPALGQSLLYPEQMIATSGPIYVLGKDFYQTEFTNGHVVGFQPNNYEFLVRFDRNGEMIIGTAAQEPFRGFALDPVPAGDHLNVHLIRDNSGGVTISILDSAGRICLQQAYESMTPEVDLTLGVAQLDPGIYFVHAISDHLHGSATFIKSY